MDWQPADTWKKMDTFLRHCNPFTTTSQSYCNYQLSYPAFGVPALAEQIGQLLTETGLNNKQDTSRGFDHGVFIPLKLMFPDTDIPVV